MNAPPFATSAQTYASTAQAFFERLDRDGMVKMGYRLVEEDSGLFFCWPVYDHANYDRDDCFVGVGDKSQQRGHDEKIARQAARLGRHTYSKRYPADQATRDKATQ